MIRDNAGMPRDNFIGGKWRASADGSTYESTSPADPERVIGRFPRSTPEDVQAAIEAA